MLTRKQAQMHREMLQDLAQQGREQLCPASAVRINIGTASCGLANGAGTIRDRLLERQDWAGAVRISSVGCVGACFAEPLVHLRLPNGYHYFFGQVNSKSLWHVIRTAEGQQPSSYLWLRAVEKQLGRCQGLPDLQILEARHAGLARFLQLQTRRLSAPWGFIDPDSIAEYAATGGYFTLLHHLTQYPPHRLREQITAAGFLTGEARQGLVQKGTVVLGDSQRLTQLEIAILENNPHGFLEGLVLLGYACGIMQAVVQIPAQYPSAAATLDQAISRAKQYGLLGEDILGTGYDLEVAVVSPEVSLPPTEPAPQPSLERLHQIAYLPLLLRHEDCVTTKIYYFRGDLKWKGFVEVPAAADLQQTAHSIMPKAAQTIKAFQVDFPNTAVFPYGSKTPEENPGGFLFNDVTLLGRHRCIVAHTLHSLHAMAVKTCRRCPVCQEKVPALQAQLSLLTKGRGYPGLLQEMAQQASAIRQLAICPLGHAAARLILTSMEYFAAEYAAHLEGYCPSLACKELIRYEILQAKCKGCRACYFICPSGAVGKRSGKTRFFVDERLCTKCGACAQTCPCGCIKPVSEKFCDA